MHVLDHTSQVTGINHWLTLLIESNPLAIRQDLGHLAGMYVYGIIYSRDYHSFYTGIVQLIPNYLDNLSN